jgi:predicted nucleic acid-binding protein
MPSVCFVDTNIFLYAQDPKTPTKRARATDWLIGLADRDLLVVSPQVLNEFAHNVLRKMQHVTDEELSASLQAMRVWCRATVTDETALQALALNRRFNLSFYDAALLSSAVTSGCDLFLSEDLSHGQKIERLQVVNPFLVEPQTILQAD